MKRFLRSHPTMFISFLALIFAGIMLAFYLWAINDIFVQFTMALIPSGSQTGQGFNLTGASKLDFRGIINGTSSASAAPAVLLGTGTTTISTGTSTQ